MPAPPSAVPTHQHVPRLEPPRHAHFKFDGLMGARLQANLHHWLQVAPDANPAMLAMFRDRDRSPARDLLPWSGEFAGKYLISAVQALRLLPDPQWKKRLQEFVAELISTQDGDGYLGPFAHDRRMTGPGIWDLWGQYHVMLGLLLWYRDTGDEAAFAACRRCADLFCKTFLEGGKRVVQAGSEEMNESSIHVFTLLYQMTGEARYLRMAREIETDWTTPPSGDYVRVALAGKAFYQGPKPRWESLPGLQAIGELYYITGEEKYRQAFTQTWWSILAYDRHNTGGFSSGEQATGNPYDPRPIETCCTIAWMALTLDYLRLTGDSRAADELELSTWNAVLGAQNETGRWWTYNTPMDGTRKAAAHDIVFQARAGSPELNCCSVNGPRGLGMVSEWAVMTDAAGLALNYYGPSEFTVSLPNGDMARLTQTTDYPVSGQIRLTLHLPKAQRFTLRLRIPSWSQQTQVEVAGKKEKTVTPGTYLVLDRTWRSSDTVVLTLDMTPRWWAGEREAAGKACVYHGPLLMAYDPRFDTYDPGALPTLQGTRLRDLPENAVTLPWPLRLHYRTQSGQPLILCDFAHAGAAGNSYVTWLPCKAFSPLPFDPQHPLRTTRAAEPL